MDGWLLDGEGFFPFINAMCTIEILSTNGYKLMKLWK